MTKNLCQNYIKKIKEMKFNHAKHRESLKIIAVYGWVLNASHFLKTKQKQNKTGLPPPQHRERPLAETIQ